MIVSNEREYAESCLMSGDVDTKPYITLTVLAKYYYHHLGYRKKKIEKCLTQYLSEHYPRYHVAKDSWNESIEKIARNAGKYQLYEIGEIWITQKELDIIDNINMEEIDSDEEIKQLAFALLCVSKLNNAKNPKNNNWVNLKPEELKEVANLSCTRGECIDMLGDLGILEMLEFPKKNGNMSNRVCYIDDASDKILSISDFRSLGYAYLRYKGHNIVRCAGCDILIPGGKTHSVKYCKTCRMNGGSNGDTRIVECIDCGEIFKVPIKNNRTCRCEDCNAEYRRNYYRENKKKNRDLKKMSTEQKNT